MFTPPESVVTNEHVSSSELPELPELLPPLLLAPVVEDPPPLVHALATNPAPVVARTSTHLANDIP
jgi:hypothetical protein